jgi:hypothetical protein
MFQIMSKDIIIPNKDSKLIFCNELLTKWFREFQSPDPTNN